MRVALWIVLASACGDSAASPDAGSVRGDSATPRTDGGASDAAFAIDAGAACALTSSTRTSTASGLAVVHRDGQSFVSWRDRAEGEAGAAFRYRLYGASEPIGEATLASAELVREGILNHSGQLFGAAFRPEDRLDPARPMAIVEEGAEPLPPWSGLAVTTVDRNGCAYYAVLATDLDGNAIEAIEPGMNATTEPIAELVAPRQPLEVYDSNERGKYSPQTRITGTPGLPLHVALHASNAQGGGAGDYGDYYLYFADRTMGWRDGLGGVFSVEETHSGDQHLLMRNRDTIVAPSGAQGVETMWFGYVADGVEGRHAYPFTEARLEWMIPWVIARYAADPERVYVSGGSMGAWGTVTFAFRRPELFAAVYPDRPRFRQRTMTSVIDAATDEDTLPTGERWTEHHDSVRFVEGHPGDLPFVGWNCGRQDGFASWQEQVDMIAALTEGRHGFAFAWNDGDHSSGSDARAEIERWYPATKFARNESYPAFTHSSIDDDPGPGDPTAGDLTGGVNLGFDWTVDRDEATTWVVTIENELATAAMTVDVTPRRTQAFDPGPGETIDVTTTFGTGTAVADENGLVTVEAVRIDPGARTTITLTRR
jgi:hypothetical protein